MVQSEENGRRFPRNHQFGGDDAETPKNNPKRQKNETLKSQEFICFLIFQKNQI